VPRLVADLVGRKVDVIVSGAGRILNGAEPGLAVEQRDRFKLVNLKTAGTLGLTIPPSVLASVGEVIE